MSKKPSNIEEYKEWLEREHGVNIDKRIENHYESVVQKIKRDFSKSLLWTELGKELNKIEEGYILKTGYRLFLESNLPELKTKSFESFIEKTFRKNIIYNYRWPEPPKNGWIFPSNWMNRINDTVRTLFVVKYLDGAEYLIEKLELFASNFDLNFRKFYEAREEGYYAIHTYVRSDFETPKIDFDTEIQNISIEIQVTTQLQEVIRRLLHKYYEEKRTQNSSGVEKRKQWQWNPESEEFSTNYLGHILHYVEGMILEIRNKEK